MKMACPFARNGFISFSPWVILSDMRWPANPTLLAALMFLVIAPAFAETLDKIVVIIDDRYIITLSDIRKERAIQAVLGTNPGTDDAIADALIERHLVEDQITQFREIDVPPDAVAERLRSLGTIRGVSADD